MTPPQNLTYVSKADGKEVVVETQVASGVQFLKSIGFTEKANSTSTYSVFVNDDADKGHLFAKLRDNAISFSRGREWNPAEVFEWLRDGCHVTGTFQSIAWTSPTEWVVLSE